MSLAMAIITAPKENADSLAGGIVERKLGACVQVVSGAQSTFMWQGKVEQEEESLLLVKTKTELQDELVAYLDEAHPYDVPELVLFPIAGGHKDYLEWMEESLG